MKKNFNLIKGFENYLSKISLRKEKINNYYSKKWENYQKEQITQRNETQESNIFSCSSVGLIDDNNCLLPSV